MRIFCLIFGGLMAVSLVALAGATGDSVVEDSSGSVCIGDGSTTATGDILVGGYDIRDADDRYTANATTDTAAKVTVFQGQNPYQSPTTVASTNRNGGSFVLAPGQGKIVVGEIVPATSAGKTITLTVTAQGVVAVGVVKTETTDFECDTVTAAQCALNILNMAAVTGCTKTCIDAACSNGQISFTNTPGTSERCAFATNDSTAFPLTAGDQGVDGQVLIPSGTEAIPGIAFSAYPTMGWRAASATTAALSIGGVNSFYCVNTNCTTGGTSTAAYVNAGNGSAGAFRNYPQTITCDADCNSPVTISSNVVIVNCTDAGGCALGLAETNWSATVSGVVTLVAGTTQTGALTLADSAAVTELAGGTNWTPTAGDTLQLVYNPSALTWAEVARADVTP